MASEFRECDARETAHQIGVMNLFSISGGRIGIRPTGLTLPVSNGYSVTVDLDWDDTYVVRRVFTRKGVASVKGEVSNVYCDEVGEIAYQASCFRNGPWGQEV